MARSLRHTVLPLIRAALARDIPLLAVCRGHQELNVALGGSLHQLVHEQPGLMDHRSPRMRRVVSSTRRRME